MSTGDGTPGPAPRLAKRSIGAVFAGLLTVVILSTALDAVLHATGVFPPVGQAMQDGLYLLALGYRCVFTVLGGYITARIARENPMHHVIILGAIGTALAIAGVLATWNLGPEFGPKWYPISLVVTAFPCVWLGGRLGAVSVSGNGLRS